MGVGVENPSKSPTTCSGLYSIPSSKETCQCLRSIMFIVIVIVIVIVIIGNKTKNNNKKKTKQKQQKQQKQKT